jgi:2-polyprenyl-6-methoxyphenol hydroxylase-like FAD-dependent oxidoreductase
MHAIIIGAGIGGLAAGIALRAAGWEITMFERASELRSGGTGLVIWSSALKALEQLGLAAAFDKHAYRTEASLFDGNGRLIVEGSKLPDSMRYVHVVHRTELLKILSDSFGDTNILFGAECVRLEQSADKAFAIFANGERREADLVIAADGLHSNLRKYIAVNDQAIYAGYTAWRAVLPYDHERIVAGEYWGPGGRFGYMPMTEQRVLWFATKNAPEGQHSARGEKEEVWRTFHAWHPTIATVIEATPEESIIRNDVYDHEPISSWVNRRALLLGDSAHAMAPVLGQGACQALEDAVILGQCLQRDHNISQALQKYEELRVSRANFFVRYARIVGKMGQLRTGLFLSLRNSALRGFGVANTQMKVLDKFNCVDWLGPQL